MNIMENKRVAAVAVVMALAFGGICFYGFDRYTELKDTQKQIAELNNKLEDYANEDIPPNAKNRDLISQAAKEAKSLSDNLHADLLQYAEFCKDARGAADQEVYKPISHPQEVQNNLRALVSSLSAYAAEKGCTLGAENQAPEGDPAPVGKFGNLVKYENAVPVEADAPYDNFLLYAENAVMRHIIDAGAPAIRKIYARELPDAAERKGNPVRLSFEVAFTAKRSDLINPADPSTLSVLPQVLNKITHDKRFFFIPTGLAVNTRESLPGNGREYFAEMAAQNNAEDSEETPANAAAVPIAMQLIGKPDETVEVYLTLQVLYFTSDKF